MLKKDTFAITAAQEQLVSLLGKFVWTKGATLVFGLLHETNGLLNDSTRKKVTHVRDGHNLSFGSTLTQGIYPG